MGSKFTEKRLSVFWIVMILIAGLLIIGDLNRRMADARRLERDALILEGLVAAKSTERVELQSRLANATSEESISAWARADAKLVREGEVLVVPMAPPGATPAAAEAGSEYPQPPSKFQVWLALIFGD